MSIVSGGKGFGNHFPKKSHEVTGAHHRTSALLYSKQDYDHLADSIQSEGLATWK
ncbi:MAG: hypothetical protein P4L51_05835 [Puia sp.]|nr:hypothetical protein [Puia sp.]